MSPSQALSALAAAASPDIERVERISPVILGGMTRAFELAMLTSIGVAIAALYVTADATELARYAAASLATAVVSGGFFEIMGLYAMPAMQRRARQLPRVIAGWSMSVALLVAAVFFLKLGHEFSRVWLAAWVICGALALIAARLALATWTRAQAKAGRLTRRAVVYGSGAACEELLKALAADPSNTIRVCGIFDDRGPDRAGTDATGPASGGRLDDLIGFARKSHIDLVLLALPVSAELRLIDLLKKLWVLPADIRLVASASRLRLSPRAYSYVGDVALIALADKPIADWGMVAKALFDKIIGLAALIALSPVMLLTALAIRLDSKGPVLFRQKRYGFNNELIEVFKFRSMYTEMTDHKADKLVTRDDPRVTRVGRVIRKTSLDELPQLFNVILGTLSLVGPRPHAVSAKAGTKLYDEAVDGYFARHKVKPGITGWAQINGWRGETDTEDKLRHRVEHDLYYIENWSVFFDAYILLKTPLSLLKSENAY